MTTVEKTKMSDPLMRPTDLSLRGCLHSKYHQELQKTQASPSIPHSTSSRKRRRESYTKDTHAQWTSKNIPEVVATISSQMPMMFGGGHTSMTRPPAKDSTTAKLVALDNIFFHCHSPTSLFDSTSPRSRDGSDSSNDMVGVSKSLLDVAKNFANRQQAALASDHPDASKAITPSQGKGRGCKRKGGWKFHDLSDESDGMGKRKRPYIHNKLENEILQLYQDRVIIKEVQGLAASKGGDRLVVIEPSYVADPDLIKHNTSLRIVLDRKQANFRLQVLPFTIEQGSLSNKTRLMSAVAKMLGENGAVLCPGFAHTQARSHMYGGQCIETPRSKPSHHKEQKSAKTNWLGFSPTSASDSSSEGESGGEKFRGKWKILNNAPSDESPRENDTNSSVTPTDRLLITLNKELTKTQQHRHIAPLVNVHTSSNCLLWHVLPPGGKDRLERSVLPQEKKWCSNCLRKKRLATESALNRCMNGSKKSIY